MNREDALKLQELTDLRSQDARHFQRPDGQIQIIVQPNQNFLSGGKWKNREDYSLTLVSGEIINNSDHLIVKVKKGRIKANKDWFQIEGLYLDDILIEQPFNLVPNYTNDTIIYKEIFTGIDIEFRVTPHKIKETIYIKKNPLSGKFTSGDNLYVKYSTSRKLDFQGITAKDARRPIQAVEKWDKHDYYLGVSNLTLRTSAYPIEIDPSVVTPVAISSAWSDNDSTVGRNDGLIRMGDSYSNDGKGNISNDIFRTYVRFDLTSYIGTVSAASIYLYEVGADTATTVYLRQPTTIIDPATATADPVWQNANGSTVLGSFAVPGGTVGWIAAQDVTTYVNGKMGGFCDFGFTGDETGGYGSVVYFASEVYSTTTQRLYLSISYSGAATAPTITSTACTSITSNSAVGNGNVTFDGGSSITERGVCWSTTSGPTIASSKTTASGTTGAFTANITSLLPSTVYYSRMYATNSIGTAYATEQSFTTLTASTFMPNIIVID